MAMGQPGRLIAFEGIDGCGKSTQARALADRLGARLTFEPGATPLGASLRTLLLTPGDDAPRERAEALMMAADRAQHVATVIDPCLARGEWVVTDRYGASTLAYQGFGRGLDHNELDSLVAWATGGRWPDLTIFLDVPVEVARERRSGQAADRFEGEAGSFLERVAEGYRTLAKGSTGVDWLVLDGTLSEDEVQRLIVAGLVERWGDELQERGFDR